MLAQARVRGLFVFILACIFVICADTRAVNISNTWVLPEEGFPVFYRYFRDRISWYEADAVCQFHHANLVTVESTSQFDALRAYLKELDIISNVWIGLSKSSDKSRFYWPDGKDMTGEGYWSGAIPVADEALCALTDPSADFRWHAFNCGGPEVASFVCELPVPSWASESDGCMLTSLPSLTIIYLPEQTAVELTSDCGLDGTKRIACKGKANHDEMMRQLSCSMSNYDFDEKSASKPPSQTSISSETKTTSRPAATKPWIWTSNTIDTGEYGFPTRHRRETEDTLNTGGNIISVTSSVRKTTTQTQSIVTTKPSFGTKEVTTPPPPQSTNSIKSTTDVETPTEFNDFPSSINQGQLFSIIENGTMFDIIEMNETNSADLYTPKSSANTAKNLNIATTPQTVNHIKQKHEKTPNDISETIDKAASKNLDGSSTKQNNNFINQMTRTNRKDLPNIKPTDVAEPATKISVGEHRVVEITISNSQKRQDGTKLYITTKKYEKTKDGGKYPKLIEENKQVNKLPSSNFKQEKQNFTADYNINIEISELSKDNVTDLNGTVKESVEITIIDPKMDANRTSESKIPEDVADLLLSGGKDRPDGEESMDFDEDKKDASSGTEEPIQPIPEEQPRPNRNRILTRPQRRSFYPYFFSRVLG